MSFPYYIAQRIYRGRHGSRQASRPAVLIALTGVAVGLAVMIVTVSIVIGFKREVSEKVAGFGLHIQVSNVRASRSYETLPVVIDSVLLARLAAQPGVVHVQRYSTKPGMIKSADSFQGMVLKGVGQEFDDAFFRAHLLEGEIPLFTDSAATNKALISRSLAEKLRLKLGDRLDTYYVQDNIRARRLTIAGIYQTNFSEYDNLFLVTDLYTVNRLNNWEPGQVSGAELAIADYNRLDDLTWTLADSLYNHTDRYGEHYCVLNVEQLNPQLFAWLNILDVNIWVILLLMTGISGFTMVSGLLILIIERTSMIGILKSLGADNTTIRKVFLWFSVFLIGKGMLWGNIIGLAFYFVQSRFGIFRLDPATYYMDKVPVSFSLLFFLLLNIGTLIASVLMLIAPSYLITRIHPANSMRYE
ncbi:MAG: ABC transporter permease [Prevotellaceae bacterium]|jgi:lipoprotein-releasing system permease protein|nr:ABC transporter permease [Prevotellaceae bacterium]